MEYEKASALTILLLLFFTFGNGSLEEMLRLDVPMQLFPGSIFFWNHLAKYLVCALILGSWIRFSKWQYHRSQGWLRLPRRWTNTTWWCMIVHHWGGIVMVMWSHSPTFIMQSDGPRQKRTWFKSAQSYGRLKMWKKSQHWNHTLLSPKNLQKSSPFPAGRISRPFTAIGSWGEYRKGLRDTWIPSAAPDTLSPSYRKKSDALSSGPRILRLSWTK